VLGVRLQPLPVKYHISRNVNTGGQSLVLQSRSIEEEEGEREEVEKKNKELEVFENKSYINKYVLGRYILFYMKCSNKCNEPSS
jgi:hypothetical protein